MSLNRREFVTKSTAAAAIGWGTPLLAANRRGGEMGAEDDVRIAVIGTGSRGGDHLRALSRTRGAKVVAVADIYAPHLEKGHVLAGGDTAGCQAYEDYHELLERSDIQAVSIATPIHTHSEVAIAALAAGKHVLCEKSMAHTVEQGEAMVEAVRRSGKFLQVGLQRRYTGFYRNAKWLIEQGVLGRITHATSQWHRNASWRRAVPKPHGEWGAERLERHINHRLYWNTSGGLMAELGSHQVDVVNWMLEETPIAVTGVGAIDYWDDGREVFDNINLIFEYPSGCKLTYTSIQANAYDGATEKLLGDKGTLVLGNKGRIFRERRAKDLGVLAGAKQVDENGQKAFDVTSGATQTSGAGADSQGEAIAETPQMKLDGTHLEFHDFLKCIRTRRQPFCDVIEGYKDSVCVALANRAMREGGRIEFGEELWDVVD